MKDLSFIFSNLGNISTSRAENALTAGGNRILVSKLRKKTNNLFYQRHVENCQVF